MLLTEVNMRKNPLMEAPPYPVEKALKRLGANLRTARVRRDLTITDVAEKIGAGPRVVADAEQGKAFTGIAVYTALLWLYGLLAPFEDLANPLKDEQGLILESRRTRTRARKPRGLDNDF
jgi:transcriptional regulator with XRE-family HTH domain